MYIKKYVEYILEMAGVDETEEDSLSLLYNTFLDLRNNKLLNYLDNIIDYDLNLKPLKYESQINKELNNDIDFYSLVQIHNQNPENNLLKKIIFNNLRIEELDDTFLNNIHNSDIENIFYLNKINVPNDYLVIPLIFENNNVKILYYIIKDTNMITYISKSICFKNDKKLMNGILYSNGKKHYDEIGIGNTINLRLYLNFFDYDGLYLNNDFINITRSKINNYRFNDFINFITYKLTTSINRDIIDTLKFL